MRAALNSIIEARLRRTKRAIECEKESIGRMFESMLRRLEGGYE